VGVEQGVGTVVLDGFGVGDRVREPAVLGLPSKVQYRHVTATGIPSAASSRTSGYIISRQVRL
jgi:hypothetical protein